jgi:CRISPR-associated protein Cas2
MRLMWLLVMFDLPVTEAPDRKQATTFRSFLLDEGFAMCQFSVYMRFCGTRDKLDRHIRKIEANIPSNGMVSILSFTDKQYGNIITYQKRTKTPLPKKSDQYVLFEQD